MNKIVVFFLGIGLSTTLLSCQPQSGQSAQNAKATASNAATSNEFTKSFPEYGFSITAPCYLKDVSQHSSGDFLINLGGVTDENDVSKMAAYQFIVTRLPIGYRGLPAQEVAKKVDDMLRQLCTRFRNVQSIRVGYEEFPGYVGYTEHQGLQQKGMMFAVNNYIIAITVMTNNDLETKFNKFSNGFKIIK